jgi:XTP/dITP diphosphohydrolase
VAFHARIAEEDDLAPFSIDDVAAGIVEKLVRRHPHVFADTSVADAREVEANWETIKAAEKSREGVFEGIPLALPALARAQKMLGRAQRAGLPGPELGGPEPGGPEPGGPELGGARAGSPGGEGEHRTQEIAEQLLAVVWQAEAVNVDAESALRDVLARWAAVER